MDFILSLAHFCEIHGPTSILSTQASPEACSICHDSTRYSSSQSSSSSGASSPVGERSHPLLSHSAGSAKFDSPLTPFFQPDSLSPPTEQPFSPFSPSSAHTRKASPAAASTTDESQSCASCTFTVPNNSSNDSPSSSPSSNSPPSSLPSTTPQTPHRSPVLRTKTTDIAPGSTPSPSDSFTSDSSDSSTSFDGHAHHPQATLPLHLGISRQPTNSSIATDSTLATSASTSGSPPSSLPSTFFTHPRPHTPHAQHKHLTTILTSHQPPHPLQYTQLRHAAIRALSIENLPRGSSSGPLLFGSTSSGYTVAFVFRIPDLRARGRRRTYAFLALSAHHSASSSSSSRGGASSSTRRIVRAMPLIISTFSHLAHRIINLCESKISRDRAHAAQLEEESLHGSSAGSAVSSNLKGMTLTPVSSFLSAKGVDPDGVPHGDRGRSGGSDGGGEFAGSGAGAGLGAMSRSLAEVAGYDMVFVEVHAGFAKLMVELSRVFGVR